MFSESTPHPHRNHGEMDYSCLIDADSIIAEIHTTAVDFDKLFQDSAGKSHERKVSKLSALDSHSKSFSLGPPNRNPPRQMYFTEFLAKEGAYLDKSDDFYEVDDGKIDFKYTQDDCINENETSFAGISNFRCNRARYNFQLGLLNTAEISASTKSNIGFACRDIRLLSQSKK